jgi:hypothetical protein
MEAALADVPARPFPRPADVITQEVCKLSGLLPTPDCPERIQAIFTPANIPSRPDDLYRRFEVCKVNGKLAFDLVPANARESKVFVVFPPPDTDWGPKNGFPGPPGQRCDDVYRGVKTAEIQAPAPETPVNGTVQVVGSAMLDDFHHLDLEVGAGASPSVWTKITDRRTEGVDKALLGVWDTARYPAGQYTLRLTVYDSFGNSIHHLSPVTLAPQASPVPSPSPAPLVPSLIPPLFGPTPVPQPTSAPQPSTDATPVLAPRTPSAGVTPTPTTPAPTTRFQPPIGQPTPTRQATPTPRRR